MAARKKRKAPVGMRRVRRALYEPSHARAKKKVHAATEHVKRAHKKAHKAKTPRAVKAAVKDLRKASTEIKAAAKSLSHVGKRPAKKRAAPRRRRATTYRAGMKTHGGFPGLRSYQAGLKAGERKAARSRSGRAYRKARKKRAK